MLGGMDLGGDDLMANTMAANAPDLGESFTAAKAATSKPLDNPELGQVAALSGAPVIGRSSIPPTGGNTVTDPRGIRQTLG